MYEIMNGLFLVCVSIYLFLGNQIYDQDAKRSISPG